MDRERFSRRGNKVDHSADRPSIATALFGNGGHHEDGVEVMTVVGVVPLTPFQQLGGHAFGGGTSNEALRRAKKHLAKKSPQRLH